MTYQIVADSGVIRSPGPGRDTQPFRPHLFGLVNSYLVIASDYQFYAELPEILDQIVRKRVIVIDNEDHTIFSARSMAQKLAMALLTLSWYSSSGSESATTPPPA
jgi:hypothetical protein